MGVTVVCPDFNLARALPLPSSYKTSADFYHDLIMTIIELDRLAVETFIERDQKTKGKVRETLFPRGLKDHLEIDLNKLRFKPPIAAQMTTVSLRSWQRWCHKKLITRRSGRLNKRRRHYLIPFSEIEPHLRPEFIADPRLILTYVTK